MRIPLPVLIYSLWGIVFLAAVVLIGLALVSGLQQRRDLGFWRFVKLVSALLGIVGVALLLVNFEVTTRALLSENGREQLLLEFIEAKSFIATRMAATCSATAGLPDRKIACWDMQNINDQLNFINVRDGKKFEQVRNWQENPDIKGFVEDVNSYVTLMNQLVPPRADAYSILTGMARIQFLAIAAILVVIAVAGSVGESAYQFRQAQKDAAATQRGRVSGG